MQIRKNIPNIITLCNLLCGSAAIYLLLKGLFSPQKVNIGLVSGLFGAALLFDFLDGFTARALKVSSEMGKQLDSLADMITFGLFPGIIMASLIDRSVNSELLSLIGLCIPLTAAIRLAKFNTDNRNPAYFYGLPTPAHAIWVFGLFYISEKGNPESISLLLSPTFIFTASVLGCIAMLSSFRLLSLKKIKPGTKAFYFLMTTVLVSLALLLFFTFYAIPLIILLYILLSIIHTFTEKKSSSADLI